MIRQGASLLSYQRPVGCIERGYKLQACFRQRVKCQQLLSVKEGMTLLQGPGGFSRRPAKLGVDLLADEIHSVLIWDHRPGPRWGGFS